MNIRRFIEALKESRSNPERREVDNIVGKFQSLLSHGSTSELKLNEQILVLTKLIEHLERHYTYVPDNLYRKLIRYNREYSRIVHKKFVDEFC